MGRSGCSACWCHTGGDVWLLLQHIYAGAGLNVAMDGAAVLTVAMDGAVVLTVAMDGAVVLTAAMNGDAALAVAGCAGVWVAAVGSGVLAAAT